MAGEGTELARLRASKSKGGRARAAALTPEQRSESARKAVNARWAKKRSYPAVSVRLQINEVGRQVTIVEIEKAYHNESLISTEVATWNVNSCSYQITQKKYGGMLYV